MSAPDAAATAKRMSGGLTIRARILLLALAVLLPAALALAWRLGDELRESREEALQTISLLRDDSTRHLSWVLQHASSLLGFVAARARTRDGDAAACQATVQAVPLLQPGFMRLEMRDASGRLVCWSSRQALPSGPPDMDEGPVAGLAVGRAQVDPRTGRLVVPLSQAVVDDAGAVQGRLRLLLDLGSMSEELSRNAAAGAVITVIDPDATILMRTHHAEEFIGKRGSIPDPSGGQGTGFIDGAGRDGIDRLYAYGTVPAAGWRV